MLDFNNLPSRADIQTFTGTATAAATSWQTWTKPRGKTMCQIILLGPGGDGGAGVIGANSTAAGGGGGGSGGQTVVTIPLSMIPDCLFLSLPYTAGLVAYVSIYPDNNATNCLVTANPGGNGGAASGATAGTAGAAGTIATAATMPLGWAFAKALAGQAGVAGGTTANGVSLTPPSTGLLITGGTGGGGLPAAAATGTSGGAFNGVGALPVVAASAVATTATTVPGNGSSGCNFFGKGMFFYGGLGSSSTHGSATGAGLDQADGGNGYYGCGGGGTGGALTGSVAGTVGKGGPAWCQIISW